MVANLYSGVAMNTGPDRREHPVLRRAGSHARTTDPLRATTAGRGIHELAVERGRARRQRRRRRVAAALTALLIALVVALALLVVLGPWAQARSATQVDRDAPRPGFTGVVAVDVFDD